MMTDEKYMVSVCITTYNMQRYIARALDSVLAQKTTFPFQIIVCDDASTDDTVNIVNTYKNKVGEQIQVIVQPHNKGLIENFITSLKTAETRYIATLDADDYWIDDYKLQKQVDHLQSNKQLSFVFSNYFNETESTGARHIAFKNNTPQNLRYEQYLLHPLVCISTACIKRSQLNFEELDVFVHKQFNAQDYPLFLYLTLHSKGSYLPEITTVYTVRKNSMSNSQNFLQRAKVLKGYFDIGNYFIQRYPVSSSIRSKYHFAHHFKVLLAAWELGTYKDVKLYNQNLTGKDFLKHQPQSLYIYIASKSKWLYRLVKPWLVRKTNFTS